MIDFKPIYDDITNSFGSLWQFKTRGNTFEIITPFATTSNKFVSVFLSKQEDSYVISDGGWIDGGIYENTFNLEEECYSKIVFHFQNSFNVKELKHSNEKLFFYKKTANQVDIPSLVFDMANFICSLVSLADVEYTDKVEKEVKERFRKKANAYLQSFKPKESLNFNGVLDEKKRIKFSVIVTLSPSKLVLINYISGSSAYYFSNSISKTNMLFELADKTQFKDSITRKISVFDNASEGFSPEVLAPFINHLIDNTHSEKVLWSEKERLQELI